MRRNFELYGRDTVFVDATFGTNYWGLALVVISAVNNEGRNVVCGYALMSGESMDRYEWLFEKLKEFNDQIEPRVVLTDFDGAVSGAIERRWSSSQHLLCQWHMQQNFKKHFMYLTKLRNTGGLLPKKLYKILVGDLIFGDCQKKFWQNIELIFSEDAQILLGQDKLRYLQKLLMIKEKWTTAFNPRLFSAGTHTTSRIEAVNSWLKQTLHQKSSLLDVLQTFKDLDRRVEQRLQHEQSNNIPQIFHHPLLAQLHQGYTRYAFEHMLY